MSPLLPTDSNLRDLPRIPHNEVSRERYSRGDTDELQPFTKSAETGLGLAISCTALPRGKRQISHIVYYTTCLHIFHLAICSPNKPINLGFMHTSGKRIDFRR